tara:strand:+ start:328 stop:450 length:123 start_codon:yes stop_codon:yes gene_type:complete
MPGKLTRSEPYKNGFGYKEERWGKGLLKLVKIYAVQKRLI